MQIRPATLDDCATLSQLHHANFPRGWSPLEFKVFFERDGIVSFLAFARHSERAQRVEGSQETVRDSSPLAQNDEVPVGFIFAWAVAGEAELLSVAVMDSARGQGLARQLCEQAMARCADLGAAKMHLEVGVSNAAARALYTALGFEMSHRRKDYYLYPDGSREDAITMKRAL